MAMAFDPNRWTIKTQEAFQAAVGLARERNNAEVTPDHLLAALVGQSEGVVLPILQRVGVAPLTVRNQVEEALSRLPRAEALLAPWPFVCDGSIRRRRGCGAIDAGRANLGRLALQIATRRGPMLGGLMPQEEAGAWFRG